MGAEPGPLRGFRALAILVPAEMAAYVEKVVPLTASMLLVLNGGGIRTYLFAAHLPHSQRPDCGQIQGDSNSELLN